MEIWDDLILPEDREAYKKYRSDNTVGFGKRPGVLVVDMTHGFTDDRFSTGCSSTGKPCIKSIELLLATARPLGVPIIYTKSSKRPTPPQQGRWKAGKVRTHDGTSCLPDPRDIVEELAPITAENPVIEKDRPSAFFGTNLVSYLNYYQVDTLIITGMTTSGCIRATVVDAFSYNYRVIVPLECVADRTLTGHKANLFDIQMKYGDVIKLEEVIQSLKQHCSD